jgi:hypothetical protein
MHGPLGREGLSGVTGSYGKQPADYCVIVDIVSSRAVVMNIGNWCADSAPKQVYTRVVVVRTGAKTVLRCPARGNASVVLIGR